MAAGVRFINLAVQFALHVGDLILKRFLLRPLLLELIIYQSQITLLLHTVVDHTGERLLLVLLNLVNSVPYLLLDLFSCLLMASDHAFYLLG